MDKEEAEIESLEAEVSALEKALEEALQDEEMVKNEEKGACNE